MKIDKSLIFDRNGELNRWRYDQQVNKIGRHLRVDLFEDGDCEDVLKRLLIGDGDVPSGWEDFIADVRAKLPDIDAALDDEWSMIMDHVLGRGFL